SLSRLDPRPALATELDPLPDSQRVFGSAEPGEGTTAGDILDLERKLGVGPQTRLTNERTRGIRIRTRTDNARVRLGLTGFAGYACAIQGFFERQKLSLLRSRGSGACGESDPCNQGASPSND
ncbi:MAG: hypothetical protein KKH37_01325, partial [Alphaproteobacteria bacterium]|nr:hypothetical protein [Alphaproteobacteria bacterium]